MLKQITAEEFQETILASDVARNSFSYMGQKTIFEHLDEIENYVMESATDIACEWGESTYADLKNDFNYDESFQQIYTDAVAAWSDGENLNREIILGVCEWLSEKTIFLGTANEYGGDIETTSFIYAKNF